MIMYKLAQIFGSFISKYSFQKIKKSFLGSKKSR